MNEAETRAELIDPALKAAGWAWWTPAVSAARSSPPAASKAPADDQATSTGTPSSDIQRGISPASSKMLVITGGGPGYQANQ